MVPLRPPALTLLLDLLQKQVLHGRLFREVGGHFPFTVHNGHTGAMAEEVPVGTTPGSAAPLPGWHPCGRTHLRLAAQHALPFGGLTVVPGTASTTNSQLHEPSLVQAGSVSVS